jgi:hypothetical protein
LLGGRRCRHGDEALSLLFGTHVTGMTRSHPRADSLPVSEPLTRTRAARVTASDLDTLSRKLRVTGNPAESGRGFTEVSVPSHAVTVPRQSETRMNEAGGGKILSKETISDSTELL